MDRKMLKHRCVREKQGVRHGDGVVEVDDVRCVELIDDVWTTAALTKEREVYGARASHGASCPHFLCCCRCLLQFLRAREEGKRTRSR